MAKKLLELAQGAELVILVKPQFELSKEKLRAGVVKVDSDREAAKDKVLAVFGDSGAEVAGVCVSPVVGTKGNTEFLAHLR